MNIAIYLCEDIVKKTSSGAGHQNVDALRPDDTAGSAELTGGLGEKFYSASIRRMDGFAMDRRKDDLRQ